MFTIFYCQRAFHLTDVVLIKPRPGHNLHLADPAFIRYYLYQPSLHLFCHYSVTFFNQRLFNRGFLEYPIFLDATAVCFVRFAGKKRKWWIELETCFLKKCYFYVLTNDTRATCYSENESTCFETSSLSTKHFFCGNFPNYSLQLCRQISSSSM